MPIHVTSGLSSWYDIPESTAVFEICLMYRKTDFEGVLWRHQKSRDSKNLIESSETFIFCPYKKCYFWQTRKVCFDKRENYFSEKRKMYFWQTRKICFRQTRKYVSDKGKKCIFQKRESWFSETRKMHFGQTRKLYIE